MHWTRREYFTFADGSGTAFLWHAQLTPASGGKTAEIDGMDLALIRDGKLCRNEVYFDRMAFSATNDLGAARGYATAESPF